MHYLKCVCNIPVFFLNIVVDYLVLVHRNTLAKFQTKIL